MRPARYPYAVLACLIAVLALLWVRRTTSDTATNVSPASSTLLTPSGPDLPPPESVAAASLAPNVSARARESALAHTRAFNDWLLSWRRADAPSQTALAIRGRELAASRRAALSYLIQTDPKLALSLAVDPGVRHELPADVQALLEERVDTRGDLDVGIRCFDTAHGHEEHVVHIAQASGRRWHAHVYGRRDRERSQADIPLHGIALDHHLALSEEPYRMLFSAEPGYTPVPGELAARVGREIRSLKGARALAEFDSIQNDRNPQAALTLPVGWNAGAKRILVIAVDYSDFASTRLTEAQITSAVADASAFYEEMTDGRTSLSVTVFPSIFQLSKTRQHYSESAFGLNEIEEETKKFALDYDVANGSTGLYNPDRADRWIIVHPSFTGGNVAAGFGLIGKRGIFLNDNFTSDVVAHELGHNAGAYHSHIWKTGTGIAYASTGEHEEYGDPFDLMGELRELTPAAHFNAVQKATLGYLPDDAVASISTTGTYRLFRHDDRHASGIRALKIAGLPYDYWLEYRRAASALLTPAQASALPNSVQIRWGGPPYFAPGDGPYLIDTHPDAANDFRDAGLVVGETFTDTEAGVTMTPLATGGSAPNEYIDVKIEFGALTGNRNPTLSFAISNVAYTARVDAPFSATATDPDGDTVQFRWDFGDRRSNPNTAGQLHRWLKGGSYTVTAVAIDGKGGHSRVSYPVTVAEPFLEWTRRAEEIASPNPWLTGLYGGGRFVFSGNPGSMITSTDGVTWTQLTVPSNLFVSDLAHNGTRFVAVGRASATALWSDDGVAWHSVVLPTGVSDLWAVAWGESRFVAVGEEGAICTSIDGQTWTEVNSPNTDQLRSIAFADNQWIAGGDSGRILTSPDGLTWTNHSLPAAHLITTIVRLGDVWYATQGASFWTSPDGATWTQQAIRGPGTYVNKAALMADGTLIAPTAGKLVWTQNLLPWENAVIDPERPEETYQAIAVGNGLVVVAGPEGRIYSSGTPTVAAPILRDLRPAPEVVAGRANSIAIAGPVFSKLELLVDGQKLDENDGTRPLTWTPARFGTYQVAARGTLPGGATITSNAESVTAHFSEWTWTSPLPFPVRLNAGVRAGDRWYLAGGGGGLFSLDDAGYATRVALGTNEPFRDIEYANGRFTAVSLGFDSARNKAGHGLWTSSDGAAWVPFSAMRGIALDGVTYGPGLWVAVGTGQILSSPDGLAWTARTLPTAGAFLNDVAFGGGQYLAVGGGGTIFASPDGITWSARTSGSTALLSAAAYANNVWVIVGSAGEILRSAEGVTWTRVASNLAEDFVAIARVDDTFVAVTNLGSVRVSDNGTTWTAGTRPAGAKPFAGIASDATNSLLLGAYGEYLTSSASPNTWVEGGGSVANSYAKVIYASGRFVAAGRALNGGARVAISNNGTTWTDATVSGPGQLNAIAWSGQQFVAAGSSGQIHTSADGVTWTMRTSGFTGGPSVDLNGTAATIDQHVVVGAAGTILSSADGATWAQRTSGTTSSLRDVTHGPSGFVAVGANGTILASTDGIAWTPRTSGVTSHLNVVTYAAGIGYIAGGAQGVVLVSDDGAAWSARNADIALAEVHAIADTPHGAILAAGSDGAVRYSGDGETWIGDALPVDRRVTGFGIGPTAIVAVGEQGLRLVQGRAQPANAPAITAQSVATGSTVFFSAGAIALADADYQWQRNGVDVANAIAPVLALDDVQPADTGIYSAVTTRGALSSNSEPAILGVTTTHKLVGAGTEFPDIAHSNGTIYDQLLLGASAAAFTADSAQNQVTRLSFVDLTNDIVQVEFSGPGTVSIVLDGSSGPAAPVNYNQATLYMKGHAGIVVTGATEQSNLTIFSVGRGTASNSTLFKSEVAYDGMADLAFVAIQSPTGKFGGLRAANASFWSTRGYTGVYAPGVEFNGPVYVHDINAQQDATPVLMIGSATGPTSITGGDLLQGNGRAVRVSGLTQLKFADGVTSHYRTVADTTQFLVAKTNRARLERDGVDVTAELVANP